MSTLASQITSLTIIYSIVIQAQIKETSKLRATGLFGGIHRWPTTHKGQWRGKCFHLMTSSRYAIPFIRMHIYTDAHISVCFYVYTCKCMYVCAYVHISSLEIYLCDLGVLSMSFFAFMSISTAIIIVILITETYWVFRNHKCCHITSMMCHYGFIMSRIIVVLANVICWLIPTRWPFEY